MVVKGTIEQAYLRVLSLIDSERKTLEEQSLALEGMLVSGRLMIPRAWAMSWQSRLDVRILWCVRVREAIMSDDPSKALPVLECLVKRLWWEDFYLTWIAPLSRSYLEMGLGPIVRVIVQGKLLDAITLRDHYQSKTA